MVELIQQGKSSCRRPAGGESVKLSPFGAKSMIADVLPSKSGDELTRRHRRSRRAPRRFSSSAAVPVGFPPARIAGSPHGSSPERAKKPVARTTALVVRGSSIATSKVIVVRQGDGGPGVRDADRKGGGPRHLLQTQAVGLGCGISPRWGSPPIAARKSCTPRQGGKNVSEKGS